MKIQLQNIRKSYGTTRVVEDVSLSIGSNEWFFILGPSGCGKTTLLRTIAGFLSPDHGDILFDGRKVNDVPPEKRHTPMVFQNYALWPHLNVFENVAYGLRVQKLPESEIERRTREALEITRMGQYEKRVPSELSGGQQQRIAISRALATNPSVLLFDEPLSNLDAKLRVEMREELLEIHRRKPFTAIYVTHDQEEAMTMASRLAVMDKGVLQQVGTPEEVYRMSKNRFVAEFMGPMNWLSGIHQDAHGVLKTPLGDLEIPQIHGKGLENKKLVVGFRPSAPKLDGEAGQFKISAMILHAQYTGALQKIWVKPTMGPDDFRGMQFQVIELNPARMRKPGEKLALSLSPEDFMVLPYL